MTPRDLMVERQRQRELAYEWLMREALERAGMRVAS